MIWIGPRMGPLHAACVASFVRHGHRVVLHAYEPVEDAPIGVEMADANRLMPEAEILPFRGTRFLALASDLMRYEILRQGLGLYVDVDVYCYRPMEDADFIFGWEAHKTIAGGVLKMPADHPALGHLLAVRGTPNYLPPWAGPRLRLYHAMRLLVGRPYKLHEIPLGWGWAGPELVSWACRETGIDSLALPFDVLYPVPGDRDALLFDPALSLEDVTTSRTRYIHVYHHNRKDDVLSVPPSSPAGRIMAGELLPA